MQSATLLAPAMNHTISFPAPKPELILSQHIAERAEPSAAKQSSERYSLDQDLEALRDREANLREYEAHLRAWQAQIEGGLPQPAPAHYNAPAFHGLTLSGSPFEGDAALHAAWEKLHRARELLEAEQTHVRDDRLNLKETAAQLQRHEAALVARETNLAKREELLAEASARMVEEIKHSPSAIARLTQVPFNMAKSVFGRKPADHE
jgi:hypothetical protein